MSSTRQSQPALPPPSQGKKKERNHPLTNKVLESRKLRPVVTVDPWGRGERVKMSLSRAEMQQRPSVARVEGAEAEDEGAVVEAQRQSISGKMKESASLAGASR